MEKKKRKVGIMGGTFDPIHVGHLILAETAYHQLGLDEVVFLPAGRPPHKQSRVGGAGNEERVEMVRLAIEGNDHFSLDLLEMEEERLSYTYITLQELAHRNPGNTYLFLIGEDSLHDFASWRHPEEIVKWGELAVFRRGDGKLEDLQKELQALRERFHGTFHLLDADPVGISSSHLRKVAKEGGSIRYYVPESVFAYIQDKGLYR